MFCLVLKFNGHLPDYMVVHQYPKFATGLNKNVQAKLPFASIQSQRCLREDELSHENFLLYRSGPFSFMILFFGIVKPLAFTAYLGKSEVLVFLNII